MREPTPSAGAPVLFLVSDQVEACPYRAGEDARCPRYRPFGKLSPGQLDTLLESGYQRVGTGVFRTACPRCRACEPVRIPVHDFQRSRSQERVWKRNQDLRVTLGPPVLDDERVALWNQHRAARGLLPGESDQEAHVYASWLVETCTTTVEVRYHDGARLIGVSVLDLGHRGANSAYHYFDPAVSRRSLGVYSVLFEVELCRREGLTHYYLGLWAADADALRYKAEYRPHERLIGQGWVRFEHRQLWTPPEPWPVPQVPAVPVALKVEDHSPDPPVRHRR